MLYTAIPGRRINSGLLKLTLCSPGVVWRDVRGLDKLTELLEAPAEVEGPCSNSSLTAPSLLLPVGCFALWCVEALSFPLVLWSLSKSGRGPVHFVLLSRAFTLLIAAAPAAWHGVREALELVAWNGVMGCLELAAWDRVMEDPTPILLRSGTISGSLSSLESLSPRVIGSIVDPFNLEEIWSWVREELNGDVLEIVPGAGVSGIQLDLNPGCTIDIIIILT